MTSSIFVVLIVILFANHHIFVCTATTNLTVKQTGITYQNKTRKTNTTNQVPFTTTVYGNTSSIPFVSFYSPTPIVEIVYANFVTQTFGSTIWFYLGIFQKMLPKNASHSLLTLFSMTQLLIPIARLIRVPTQMEISLKLFFCCKIQSNSLQIKQSISFAFIPTKQYILNQRTYQLHCLVGQLNNTTSEIPL